MLDAARDILPFAAIAVFLLSVIAALALRPKYLELICHFRLQYAIGAVALAVVCVASAEWMGAAVAFASVLLNFPVLVSARRTENPVNGRRFKLLLMNVYRLNRRYDLCVDYIRKHQPDVVVAQELNEAWAKEFACLEGDYPFANVRPMSDGSGIALYSHLEFELLPLVLPEGDARPGILAKLSGNGLTILSIHPRAPIRPGHFEARNQMLRAGAAVMRDVAGPRLCVGDLNTTMWSPYLEEFATQSGLRSVRKGFGVLTTWPTFMGPKWLMIPIDHCLVSDDIRVLQVHTGDHIGSDHLPLLVELELPSATARRNDK